MSVTQKRHKLAWSRMTAGERTALMAAVQAGGEFFLALDYRARTVRPSVRGTFDGAVKVALTLGGWREIPQARRGAAETWALEVMS